VLHFGGFGALRWLPSSTIYQTGGHFQICTCASMCRICYRTCRHPHARMGAEYRITIVHLIFAREVLSERSSYPLAQGRAVRTATANTYSNPPTDIRYWQAIPLAFRPESSASLERCCSAVMQGLDTACRVSADEEAILRVRVGTGGRGACTVYGTSSASSRPSESGRVLICVAPARNVLGTRPVCWYRTI
jgi:hypothetical protein